MVVNADFLYGMQSGPLATNPAAIGTTCKPPERSADSTSNRSSVDCRCIQPSNIALEEVLPGVQGVLPAHDVSGRIPSAIVPTGSGVLPRALRLTQHVDRSKVDRSQAIPRVCPTSGTLS